jgi:hypothetical protein
MTADTRDENRSANQWRAGSTTLAAAAVLLTSGILTVVLSVSAVAANESLVIGADYLDEYTTSGRGWVHIIFGIVLAAVSFGLFWGTGGEESRPSSLLAGDRRNVSVATVLPGCGRLC